MDNESRLDRALAADTAPARDPAFTVAVLRAAEDERYRRETARSILRGAGFVATLAGLAVPFLGWASVNSATLQSGMLGAAALYVLVGIARLMSAWVTAVLRS